MVAHLAPLAVDRDDRDGELVALGGLRVRLVVPQPGSVTRHRDGLGDPVVSLVEIVQPRVEPSGGI